MFDWLFGNNIKRAEKKHEALLSAKLANKLMDYNSDEDISVSRFSEVDFKENTGVNIKQALKEKNRDGWGESNPREAGKWHREERRSGDRRRQDRRK
jgi:hypothetical protein